MHSHSFCGCLSQDQGVPQLAMGQHKRLALFLFTATIGSLNSILSLGIKVRSPKLFIYVLFHIFLNDIWISSNELRGSIRSNLLSALSVHLVESGKFFLGFNFAGLMTVILI